MVLARSAALADAEHVFQAAAIGPEDGLTDVWNHAENMKVMRDFA